MLTPQLTYYDIHPQVLAFSTQRGVGYSSGNYGGFNLNPYCGDAENSVMLNRMALCEHLGLAPANMVLPHQTHGTESLWIDRDYWSLPLDQQLVACEGKDAVITQQAGVLVGVSTADCVPVLLYDETSGTIAAIHAGWRGTAAGIVAKTLRSLADRSVDVANLRAVIGPCIGLEAFEVGDEVVVAFAEGGYPLEDICKYYDGKPHIDLSEANSLQLLEGGVCEDNIYVSGVCTYSNSETYFSARRLGIDSGRIFTGIMIKPNDDNRN